MIQLAVSVSMYTEHTAYILETNDACLCCRSLKCVFFLYPLDFVCSLNFFFNNIEFPIIFFSSFFLLLWKLTKIHSKWIYIKTASVWLSQSLCMYGMVWQRYNSIGALRIKYIILCFEYFFFSVLPCVSSCVVYVCAESVNNGL